MCGVRLLRAAVSQIKRECWNFAVHRQVGEDSRQCWQAASHSQQILTRRGLMAQNENGRVARLGHAQCLRKLAGLGLDQVA